MEHQIEEGPDPRIGMLLQERYRIVRKLGEGGMGAVYEANHELIGRRLAVKCLHQQFASDPQVVARFQREAQASSMVGSEHIIEVTDMGRFPDGAPFMVMEYLEGSDVSKVLEKIGALPVSRVCHIMTQVCQALSAAHSKGIVHRDLKPENVYLITRKGDPDFVKVLDFGISKMKEHAESLSSGLTKTGMALGTPYYMAPEQAQGLKDVDHRTDIYALGVILFEALTGHLPYDADTYPLLMVKIMTEAPPLLRSYRPDLPAELEQVVLRAIAKNREERFQTVEDLAAALQPFRDIDGVPVVTVPPARPMMQPSSSGTTGLSWTKGSTNTGPGAQEETAVIRQNNTPMLIALAGVALLLFGGGAIAIAASGVLSGGGGTTQAAVPPRIHIPTPPMPQLNPQLNPQGNAPQNPPAQREVEITIQTTPAEGVHAFVGEVEYPTGLPFSQPRSLTPVRVRIERSGYRTIEQMTIFDRDRTLAYELQRGRGVQRLEMQRDPAPAGGSGQAGTAAAGGSDTPSQPVAQQNTGGGERPPRDPEPDPGPVRPPTKTITGLQNSHSDFP